MKRIFAAGCLLALVIPAQSQPRAPKAVTALPRHGGPLWAPPAPTPPPSLCNPYAVRDAAYLALYYPVKPQPTPQPTPCTEDGPDGYALAICEAARETARLQAELQVAHVRESNLRSLKIHVDRCS